MTTRGSDRTGPAHALAELLRGALWPVPFLGVLVAIGLGVLLPAVDGRLAEASGDPLTFVFGGGAAAARDLLAAIAGSLISVTGLTFSLTVIALQLSSSQYSPRLLQTFVTDRVVQLTLAQLVLTFVYALTVLRTVRTESATEDDSAFVPRLSITFAYLLTLGSVLALVFFLGHLAQALRVETMLRDVHDEASRTLDREQEHPSPEPSTDGPVQLLIARSSGFLVGVDERAAAEAARRAGAVVRLRARVGDAVVAGTPLGHVWRLGAPGPVDAETLAEELDTAVRLRFERTASGDVAYSLRKITDIAVRALSPGVNDPTTAVHALSHASALLGELAQRRVGVQRLTDDEGAVRVVLPPWELPALVQLAVEEPLQFADGQPAVLRRLAGLFREVAWRARGRGVDELLRGHVATVAATAVRTTGVSEDEARSWRLAVDQALAGEWPPGPS